MSRAKCLTLQERLIIQDGIQQYLSYPEIGKLVGRSQYTVKNDVQRFCRENSCHKLAYDGNKAHTTSLENMRKRNQYYRNLKPSEHPMTRIKGKVDSSLEIINILTEQIEEIIKRLDKAGL